MQPSTSQDNYTITNREEILESYLVVTAVDKNYLKIFDLWLHYFEKLDYNKCLRVITYDAESEAYVNKKGITVIPVKEKIKTVRDIFVTRLTVMLQLLKSGKNIIHTDADAFWLKDPLPATIKKDIDLQISIGHGIPRKVRAKWGFTLCCGFFVFQSNARTIKFFDAWIPKSIELNHDQNALNELFLDNATKWKFDSAFNNMGYCPVFDMSIEAIDYKIISRRNNGETDYIFHPHLSSNNSHIKLLNVLNMLMKINRDSFLRRVYYKTLFNLSGWLSLVTDLFKKLKRGFRKLFHF